MSRQKAKEILFETLKFQGMEEFLFSTGKITDNSGVIETFIDAMVKFKNSDKEILETTPHKRFNIIVDRYKSAFNKTNGYLPFKIWFENGWVHLVTRENSFAKKIRVGEFEMMTFTLEKR